MSQSNKKPVICTYKIGISDEAKKAIADFCAGVKSASELIEIYKSHEPNGDVLAVMDAANDGPQPELKQLGQWVFAGCDPRIKSASVDSDGEAARWGCDKNELDLFEGQFVSPARVLYEAVEGKFDTTNWRNSAINRQPVNDVDYLTDSDSEHDIAPREFKQLGQWVFEGQNEKWKSAAKNNDGSVYLHNMSKNGMYFNHDSWGWAARAYDKHEMIFFDDGFDPSVFAMSFIERLPLNDVDDLTDSDSEHDVAPAHEPELRSMAATLAVADDMQSLSKNDLQSVFIKNMSNLLIQRMHSMDRFSDDDNDYEINADQLMPWDVIYDMGADRFGFVTASQKEHIAAYFLTSLSVHSDYGSGACFHRSSLLGKALRTITEDEVMNFCCVLEAYHA